MLWDRAPYHRARVAWVAATRLGIQLLPLPDYSPDLMVVGPLWHWLGEDVTYYHCHVTADDLIRRVVAFEAKVNTDPCAGADPGGHALCYCWLAARADGGQSHGWQEQGHGAYTAARLTTISVVCRCGRYGN